MNRKGKNAYAAKMMAAKAVMSVSERKALIDRCITTIYQASAVALNEKFGFGAERIGRFRDELNDTILEYGALMDGADVEYADSKLEQRYRQIMKEDNINEQGHGNYPGARGQNPGGCN